MAGNKPNEEDMILTRDADFINRYQKKASDPAFPDGTTAEIVITETNDTDSQILATWPAYDVTAGHIDFWVQSELANAIDTRLRYRLMVHYPPSMPGAETQDWCWYKGAVRRDQ